MPTLWRRFSPPPDVVRAPAVAALASIAVLGVAGCGARGAEFGRRVTSTHEPTLTAPMTTDPAPRPDGLRTTSIHASCTDQPWAFGFTPVEPALGNRYLSVQVRNCAAQPMTLPAHPLIRVRDASGKNVAVQWDWRAARTSLKVRPQHDVWLRLHWHSSGRCDRGGTEMELTLAGQTGSLEDCLELGGLSEVTGETPTADATWALSH